MTSSVQAERKRFELWYNNHYDMELITGPDDVEAAWEIWKAAIDGTPVHPIGYVGFSNDGEINKFRTGNFGSGYPVYLSPVSAALATPGNAKIAWSRFQSMLREDDPAKAAHPTDSGQEP